VTGAGAMIISRDLAAATFDEETSFDEGQAYAWLCLKKTNPV
jgi:hypothetical protein